MRLRKAELATLTTLAESNEWGSSEEFVEALVKRWEELRGERTHVFACAIVAGVPIAIGPVSTRNQAEKMISKIGAEKGWAVPGWTAEGWERHLKELDAEPEPYEPTAAEQKKRESGFWAAVQRIREHETTAIVGKSRQDIEIKAVALPKGYWG